MTKRIGILSFGSYIPEGRVKILDIAVKNGVDPAVFSELGIFEKSVNADHEDTTTMATLAGLDALQNFKAENIEALFVGSETHVYAVKPTGTIVANLLGLPIELFCADLEFACKGGTAAMQVVYNFAKAGSIKAGLAMGADTGKGAPKDALEYSASSGAAAFVIGDLDSYNGIAEIIDTVSITTDMPDFWRGENDIYPHHTGRFSALAYEQHISMAIHKILQKSGMEISEFAHVVLHMPNGKLPKVVAKKLGITEEQLKTGFIVPYIGNAYSAQTLLGLCEVLKNAKAAEKILICSYGSGSGSDAMIINML
jgi:hydroxymethylglutaryl-CoA synthase